MQTTNFPSIIQRALASRRKLRVSHALSKISKSENMKVLDIGCGIDGRSFEDYVPEQWEITGLDVHDNERIKHSHPNFRYTKGDATNLSQFADKTFDLAISIGMLEHITEESMFNNVVSETIRVAKQYIVIVPYKYALIEPHYGVPFFPIIPYKYKLALIKLFNLSNHREAVTNDPQYVNKNFMWLSNSEYKKHFPGSDIYIAPTMDTIAIVKTN